MAYGSYSRHEMGLLLYRQFGELRPLLPIAHACGINVVKYVELYILFIRTV